MIHLVSLTGSAAQILNILNCPKTDSSIQPTIAMLLILFIVGIKLSISIPECPRNSVAFDYQECDPNKRSQCPGGFTCRKGNDTDNLTKQFYLCCDNTVMKVDDWFSEVELVPQIFPQGPLSMIKNITLTPVEQGVDFPAIHIGDEVVVLSYEQYVAGMAERITFDKIPPPSPDPGYRPTAIFFNYNQPSTGSLNVLTQNPQVPLSLASWIDSTQVPIRDSYRALYVVFVFRTNYPVNIGSQNRFNQQPAGTDGSTDGAAMMNGCTNVTCLLSNTSLGRDLGQPQAATMFYLTTRRTVFDTSGQQSSICSFSSAISSLLLPFFLYIFA